MSSPRKLSPHEWAEIQADHRLVHLLESDRIVDHIAALRQEHEEDQGVIRVWRGRAERAEAERDSWRILAEKSRERAEKAEQQSARLKPTGQIAEDVAKLRDTLDTFTGYSSSSRAEDVARLNRLAATAQWASTFVEAVSTLLDLPFVIEEATIPSAGIDAAPDQVVGTLHVSVAKIRKLKEILAQIGGT